MIALLPEGLELAYDESGRGIPLLFIHGWPHDRSLWSSQLSGLSSQARCIAPDLRGFGESPARDPITIDQFADDLVLLLDSLDVDRAVVCGLSMGGYVAMAMWRRHRARVRGFVLADTRATADTAEAREKRIRLIELVEKHGVEALAARQLKAMVGRTTFETRPQLLASLHRMMASAPSAGVIGGLRAMAARPDSTELLATIDVPSLVVGGAEDTFTTPDELRALAAAMPRCGLELLDGAGHVAPFERPAAFNHVVGEFLGSIVYD